MTKTQKAIWIINATLALILATAAAGFGYMQIISSIGFGGLCLLWVTYCVSLAAFQLSVEKIKMVTHDR